MSESLNELSKKTLKSYVKKADQWTDRKLDDMKTPMKKIDRRMSISNKVEKSLKEDIEELDELSSKTLGSYINKASKSASNARANATTNIRKASKIDGNTSSGEIYKGARTTKLDQSTQNKVNNMYSKADKYDSKADKRYSNIGMAKKKLKEDTMEIKSLLDLTEDKNIVDFQSLLAEVLNHKAVSLVESMRDPEDDEVEDEFDFEDDDSDVTEEEMEWIAENISEEDFEQLDELSKKTLGSYIQGASRETRDREKYKGQLKTADSAISNASHELDNTPLSSPKSSSEPRNNFRNASYDARKHLDSEGRKNDDKMSNRRTGIRTAVNKLTKEENELDEGRGAKGAMRHMPSEDEWGTERKGRKEGKFSLRLARKKKEAMREEANQDEIKD